MDETRRILLDDIGVDPGPALVGLEAAILVHDDAILGWSPPVAPAVSSQASPAPAAPPVDAVVGGEVRFCRRNEDDAIRAALDRLPSRGGVFVVAGEPGICKTAVLRALRVEAQRRGIVVGWDRCPESAAGAPYRSWRSAVEALLPANSFEADERSPEQR